MVTSDSESSSRTVVGRPWLMSVPNGRHYAVLEAVGDARAGGASFTDGDLDRADRWFVDLRPDATPACSGPDIVRWHVPDDNYGCDHWQGEATLGSRVALLTALDVADAVADGFQRAVAVPLPALVEWWASSVLAVPRLLGGLGCEQGRLWLALQTCLLGGPPVVDLSFADLIPPRRAAPATSVPPWHYGPVSIRFDNPSLGVLTDAVASLLRHFSYRHPQQCLGELGLPLAGDAG